MEDITSKKARSLAASLINGIRTSLLLSMEENTPRKVKEQERRANVAFSYNSLQNTSNNIQGSCNTKHPTTMLSNSCNTDGCTKGEEFDKLWSSVGSDNEICKIMRNQMHISSQSFDNNERSSGSYCLNDTGSKYVKRCPKCFEINDKDSNWCMECGKAIISVEVRKCDSFEEETTLHTACNPKYESKSLPFEHHFRYRNSISYEDDQLASYSNSMQCKNEFSYGQNMELFSVPFDFHDPQFDEDLISRSKADSNMGIFHKSYTESSAKEEVSQMYAFDDLLYPDFAIHNPVYGFVLPSSNIVSNGAYFRPPQFFHTGTSCHDDRKNYVQSTRSKKNSKRGKNRKKKKENKYIIGIKDDLYEKNNQDVYRSNLSSTSTKCNNEISITNLPEEVLIHAFSFLPLSDLAKCTRVCKLLYRVASDAVLWKEITVKKKNNLTDNILAAIARKHPSRLTITRCNGKMITMDGLRHLFQSCADTLQELDISGSSGGVLIGETVLLHVSSRCKNIRKLDIGWSNISNDGLQAVSNALSRLEQLSLNGCQGITDESIKVMIEKHGKSLECLEVFGCFNVSSVSINYLAAECKTLRKLNLGQCHKINNQALSVIAKNMSNLESFDIRGCKQIRDGSLTEIIQNCNKLTNLIIANCPFVTDASLISIGNYLPGLRCLDACGCCKITDRGIFVLVKNCCWLEVLDLSSTRATGKSVTTIANYRSESLASLKLSFCSAITLPCLQAVVSKCKRLKILHLYGCKPIRHLHKLTEMNPLLKIERESLR